MTKKNFNNWYLQNKTDIDNLFNIWINKSNGFLNINPDYYHSKQLYNVFCKFIYKNS